MYQPQVWGSQVTRSSDKYYKVRNFSYPFIFNNALEQLTKFKKAPHLNYSFIIRNQIRNQPNEDTHGGGLRGPKCRASASFPLESRGIILPAHPSVCSPTRKLIELWYPVVPGFHYIGMISGIIGHITELEIPGGQVDIIWLEASTL